MTDNYSFPVDTCTNLLLTLIPITLIFLVYR